MCGGEDTSARVLWALSERSLVVGVVDQKELMILKKDPLIALIERHIRRFKIR